MNPSKISFERVVGLCGLWLAIAPEVLGCGGVQDESEGAIAHTNQSLHRGKKSTGDLFAFWPSGQDVNVCWDDAGNAEMATFRTNVENWVRESYGRNSALRIVGWNLCQNPGAGTIAIRNSFTSDITNSFGGYNPSGYNYINYGHLAFSGFGAYPGGDKRVVLHEFGHALGFGEENYSQGNDCGNAVRTGSSLGTPTNEDTASIMVQGGCNYTGNNDLSPWDIVGLQNVFGTKPAGTIVGKRNFCIDMNHYGSESPAWAEWLQAHDCYGNSNQKWKLSPIYAYTGTYRITSIDYPIYYNTFDTHTYNNGQQLWTYLANGTLPQAWELHTTKLVGMGGLCLNVPYNNKAPGQTVELYECLDWAVSETWTIQPSGNFFQIKFEGVPQSPFYCLSTVGGITLQPCDGSVYQQFDFSAGHIVARYNMNYCIGAYPSSYTAPANGTPISLYTCQPTSAPPNYIEGTRYATQRWFARGVIMSVGNSSKCIHMGSTNGIEQIGSPIDIQNCNSTDPAHVWDFHF